MLRGAIAAALTPLSDGGAASTRARSSRTWTSSPVTAWTGSSHSARPARPSSSTPTSAREIARLFVDACRDRLQVAVHCGAQSTADTVELAEHAAMIGADAVAVIAPPYFALDEQELLAHFAAAARACAPLPFYVYEFAARSGYAIPLEVLERLRDEAPNLVGHEGLRRAVGAARAVPAGWARRLRRRRSR